MKKLHKYAGIDPGITGAISIVHANGSISISSIPYLDGNPDIPGIMTLLKDCSLITIESVHSMPKQGIASTSKFMKQFGMILGALLYHSYISGCKINLVSPNIWKKAMLGPGKHEKEDSINRALKIVEEETLKRSARCTTLDHNRAESLLICLYGFNIETKETT